MSDTLRLTTERRGCAAFMGRDVSKLKGKGGGKFKYMSEKDMLELAAKFAPYRYVATEFHARTNTSLTKLR